MTIRNLTPNQNSSGKLHRVPALAAVLLFGLMLQQNSALADIDNTAIAQGDYASTTYYSDPATFSVPVVPTDLNMQVVKTANPNSNVSAGTIVTYTYVVTNSGNVTIKNIQLSDLHNAAGPAPVPGSETLVSPPGKSTDATSGDGIWDSLAPGDAVTFTATYTVQQSDVDQLQ